MTTPLLYVALFVDVFSTAASLVVLFYLFYKDYINIPHQRRDLALLQIHNITFQLLSIFTFFVGPMTTRLQNTLWLFFGLGALGHVHISLATMWTCRSLSERIITKTNIQLAQDISFCVYILSNGAMLVFWIADDYVSLPWKTASIYLIVFWIIYVISLMNFQGAYLLKLTFLAKKQQTGMKHEAKEQLRRKVRKSIILHVAISLTYWLCLFFFIIQNRMSGVLSTQQKFAIQMITVGISGLVSASFFLSVMALKDILSTGATKRPVGVLMGLSHNVTSVANSLAGSRLRDDENE
ncbi:hypothetical protein HDU91_001818 [Kappamyces sp. JEL0680]|nr:hypothetical protein HDU91_001818 [Kappamyces sp. JEL0680]